MSLKEKAARFMYGRYGADQFSVFILVVYLLVSFANLFTDNVIASAVLYALSIAAIVYWFYRILSRKIAKRQGENAVFLKIWRPFAAFFVRQFNRIRYIKKYRYRKCPHCKNFLRLPAKKGKHNVRCPKCGGTFDVSL